LTASLANPYKQPIRCKAGADPNKSPSSIKNSYESSAEAGLRRAHSITAT